MKPGVLELLDRCTEAEIPVAVATSTQSKEAKRRLDLAELRSKFLHTVGDEQVAHGKPSPDIYL